MSAKLGACPTDCLKICSALRASNHSRTKRFGKLPSEVANLLDIVKIKQLCRKAGIGQVEAGPKGAVIGFHKDSPPNVEALLKWVAGKRGGVKLRPDQKLVAMRMWDDTTQRVKGVQNLIQELAAL